MAMTCCIKSSSDLENKTHQSRERSTQHRKYCDLILYVNHDILINKLYAYGVRGNISLWLKVIYCIEDYVFVNNNKSELKIITFGIPQGSVIGPLFFILYINDLSTESTKCSQYYLRTIHLSYLKVSP